MDTKFWLKCGNFSSGGFWTLTPWCKVIKRKTYIFQNTLRLKMPLFCWTIVNCLEIHSKWYALFRLEYIESVLIVSTKVAYEVINRRKPSSTAISTFCYRKLNFHVFAASILKTFEAGRTRNVYKIQWSTISSAYCYKDIEISVIVTQVH